MIDLARQLICTRAWGVVTHEDLTVTRSRMIADPAFRSDLRQLYDMRDVTSIAATVAEVRQIASYSSPFGSGVRRAFVASKDSTYGLVRMFALNREANGGQEQIEVFRSLADAEAWLGLPEQASQACFSPDSLL
jgi:hypothetical protein